MPFHHLTAISAATNNLPLLSAVKIDGRGEPRMASEVTKIFTVAPRLEAVVYCGPAAALFHLPLEQLRVLAYCDVSPQDVDYFIPMLDRLCETELLLRLDLWDAEEPHPLVPDLPVVTSDLRVLTIVAIPDFNIDRATEVMSHMMARLTLPSLSTFRFQRYQPVPLPWPHLAFSSLCRRSSFSSHLSCLSLHHVLITEAELVQTISRLPLLRQLQLCDHKETNYHGADLILITDSLLRRLTWSPDPTCLVPDLNSFECHTLLQFDDVVYRDFILSRLDPGRNEERAFTVNLMRYWGLRELDPAVVGKFDELQSQGQLLFSTAVGPN
ncbi:hypothetical protein DFH09DRAFT_1315904 [Mycena vulgaris]|nr:hypothetical protein DFH09DRAFT_1315904 [Mycena vulgaris]